MNNLQVFNYNGNEVRTIQKDGEPWWVLKDVCEVLGLSSPHKVFDRLDEDEKGRNQIPTPGGRAGNDGYQRKRLIQCHSPQ